VRGRNVRRGGNRKVSFLDEVYVDVYGVNVRFLQKNRLLVNGERVSPPLSPVDGLSITMNSRQLQLTTDFGLTVRFDGNHRGEVVLPSTYSNAVRGLCGNYDGNSKNEYMKPDGTLTRSLDDFGNSWRVSDRAQGPDTRRATEEGPTRARLHRREVETAPDSGFVTSDCTQSQLEDYMSVGQCGALSDPTGPFAACHAALPPASFQDDCVFDLCAESGSAALRCASYDTYAAACQEEGVKLGGWRHLLNCSLSCPANSSYAPCMSACPASCADLAAPAECDAAACVEGCRCDADFVMSEGACVPFPQCGCTFLNRYYPLNERFVTEDCAQECVSTPTGADCKPKTCQPGYVCAIYELKRDCYKASPCLSYPCQNGGTCQEASNSTYTCQCADGFEGSNCEVEKTETGGLETKWIIVIAVLASVVLILIVILVSVCVCTQKTKKQMGKYEASKLGTYPTSVPYEDIDDLKKELAVKDTAF